MEAQNTQTIQPGLPLFCRVLTRLWFSRTHSHPSPETVTILTNSSKFSFEKAALLEKRNKVISVNLQ